MKWQIGSAGYYKQDNRSLGDFKIEKWRQMWDYKSQQKHWLVPSWIRMHLDLVTVRF